MDPCSISKGLVNKSPSHLKRAAKKKKRKGGIFNAANMTAFQPYGFMDLNPYDKYDKCAQSKNACLHLAVEDLPTNEDLWAQGANEIACLAEDVHIF